MSSSATTNKLDDALQQALAQDIFVGLGLDDLAESERQELLDTMLATIKDRVLARVLDELSADQRSELTRLTNAGRTNEVSEFVAEHVPDLDALMTEEAVQYKAEMIQNTRHIRKLLEANETDAETVDDNLPAVIPDDLPIPYVPPGLPATQDEAPPVLSQSQ